MNDGARHIRSKRSPTSEAGSAEIRFLLICCRPDFNVEARRQAEALWSAGLDWQQLLRLAVGENVLPLLTHRLTAFYMTRLPRAVLAELSRRLFDNASRNMIFVKELSRILEFINQQGIRALTFKGPVLSQIAYGGANLRRFNDVDIIVHEEDYARCQARLYAAGYDLLKDYGFEVAIRHRDCWAIVDLHRRITSSAFPFPADFESWWKRREVVEVSGHALPTLSVTDHLLVIIVQIARDRYEDKLTLAKLCDVAALLHSHPELDPDRIVFEAERLGARRRALAVLGAVADLLASPLPTALSESLGSEAALARLVRFTGNGVLGRTEGNLGTLLARIYFHFQVHDRLGQKLAQFNMVPFKLKDLLGERS